MVVKEDGTKWACQSCLKGHRVSGCTHTDRELFFVPKKGRPVTQCPHCRAERKKRSSHVKCDCGEKPQTKEKCIHLREAEAKAAAAAGQQPSATTPGERHSPDLAPLAEESSASSADEHHCCCPHGGQCTCSTLKHESPSDDAKDTKELKPLKESKPLKEPKEFGEPIAPPARITHQRSKPRLTSHQSEGHLTVFANGHHKPCHRNNNAAHESGAPYKLPRSHTAQSASSISRRSVDSLASVAASQPQSWFHPAVSTQPKENKATSITSAPQPAAYQNIDSQNQSQNQQYSMSDASSSVPNSMLTDFGYPSASSLATTTTESSMPAFSLPSSDINMTNGFWSNYDWTKFDSSSFDAQPALTNASSGTLSEVDELPANEDMANIDNPYALNMQDLVNNSGLNNTANTFDLDFASASGQSNRWSMPVNLAQNVNTMEMKQSAEQPMDLNQFSTFDFQQTNGSGLSSSVQSQSPAQTNFGWDQSLYDFAMTGSNVNEPMAFSMPGSSGPSASPTAAPSPKFNTDNGDFGGQNFDFDNSSKAVDWSDSMLIPASQDFLNTYSYDQNFATDFNNAWTS